MYKVNSNHSFPYHYTDVNNRYIGFKPLVDNKNLILFSRLDNLYRGHMLRVHILKKESDYIPIICLFNTKDTQSIKISKEDFKSRAGNLTLSSIYQIPSYSSKLTSGDFSKQRELLDETFDNIYDLFSKLEVDDKYSRNIPVDVSDLGYDSSIRISDVDELLFYSSERNMYCFDNKKCTSSLFYYTYENRIIFTMVIKKEYIKDFKINLKNNLIDQKHVEIWVDKSIIEGNDRKQFHKHLRENIMMKLFMKGFVIKEKDDILSDLIIKPKINFESIGEVKTLKENLGKFLIS